MLARTAAKAVTTVVARAAPRVVPVIARAAHTLPELPFSLEEGLAPAISPETLDFHYNKHHATYVNTANTLIEGTPYEKRSLVDTIHESHVEKETKIFNATAQIWNHSFYWQCMTPGGVAIPEELKTALTESFGGVDQFKDEFTKAALGQFGSGWAWLVQDEEDKLKVVTTSNAGVPFVEGLHPLLTCDVWEHAYYIDHRNRRPEYIEKWWEVVNWKFVDERRSMS